MTEQRKAPHDLYGYDGEGVRRIVRAGDKIPRGLVLEEDLDTSGAEPAEAQRLRQEQAARADDATTTGSVGGVEEGTETTVVEGDGSQTTEEASPATSDAPKPRARRGRSSS